MTDLDEQRAEEYAFYRDLYLHHGYTPLKSKRLTVTTDVITEYGKPGRWLDAGCGGIRIAVPDGVELVRCDPAHPDADHNLAIHELPSLGVGSFDVVSSFDVLEHVFPAELEACVLTLWSMLKPGGRLITSVGTDVGALWQGRSVHLTVQPPEWWQALLQDLLGVEAPMVAISKGTSPFFVQDKPV